MLANTPLLNHSPDASHHLVHIHIQCIHQTRPITSSHRVIIHVRLFARLHKMYSIDRVKACYNRPCSSPAYSRVCDTRVACTLQPPMYSVFSFHPNGIVQSLAGATVTLLLDSGKAAFVTSRTINLQDPDPPNIFIEPYV